jgi:hypothetical protein
MKMRGVVLVSALFNIAASAFKMIDIIDAGKAALQSSPRGVFVLWGVASAVIIPLTMYRQA